MSRPYYRKLGLLMTLTLFPAFAIAQSAPVTSEFVVQSTAPWQATGITVAAGTKVNIAAVGMWTANPASGMCGPQGTPQYIAKPGYTLPGAHEGALIGRVASAIFMVGVGAEVPQGVSGPLELCINDDLNGRYGAGLADNIGSVTVKVTH